MDYDSTSAFIMGLDRDSARHDLLQRMSRRLPLAAPAIILLVACRACVLLQRLSECADDAKQLS